VDEPDEGATLFVYGSLLDPMRRQEILGRQVDTVAATLADYEVGRARYFYVARRPGIKTRGLLLLNLTPRDFEALDRYEEIPQLYTRNKVEVLDERGKPLQCWIYLPTDRTLSGT
jgi:gamma-glutamylcyclotransferase (GGCT)/AIG2-like uncharacterized protein YtfP